MENLAKDFETMQPGLEYVLVVAAEKDGFLVRGSCGLIKARVAASCIVRPGAGDRVLLVGGPGQEGYILAVLQKGVENAGHTRLVFEGQVDMQVNGGGLRLTTANDMALAAGGKLDMAASEMGFCAERGRAVIGRMSFVFRCLKGQVKRIKMVAGSVENIFRRLTQRLKDSFSFVEDHSEVQAGSARYLVDDTLTMNSKNAVHMAEEIVTINAEQIHLG